MLLSRVDRLGGHRSLPDIGTSGCVLPINVTPGRARQSYICLLVNLGQAVDLLSVERETIVGQLVFPLP